MKRGILGLLVAIVIFWAMPSGAGAAQYARVTLPAGSDALFVRSAPDSQRRIVGAAKSSEELVILSQGGSWHRVRVSRTGVEGYVSASYVTLTAYGGAYDWDDDWDQGYYDDDREWTPEPDTSRYTPDNSVLDADSVVNRDGVVSSSDGFANLRWGPGLDFGVITRAYNGQVVWALEQNGEWYRCATQGGQIGYIHQNILRLGETAGAAYGSVGVVRSRDGFASVREGAGLNQTELYTLLVGQTTGVYGASGDWFRVSRAGGWGDAYVYRTLLRFLSEAILTGDARLYGGPNASYRAMNSLYAGQALTLLATDGNYCRVDTGGEIGFVSRQSVRY